MSKVEFRRGGLRWGVEHREKAEGHRMPTDVAKDRNPDPYRLSSAVILFYFPSQCGLLRNSLT